MYVAALINSLIWVVLTVAANGKRHGRAHELVVPEFLGSEPYIITGESILRDYGESKRSHVVLKGKRNHLIKPRSQKKHRIPAVKGKWMPKHVIERSDQPNPFGHLSELLGIKGSFIPSQAHQNWLGDEEQSSHTEAESEANAESRPRKSYPGSEITPMHGTLPLDVSPQQANFIASTADSNKQRQKFMNWEHQGGSMDIRHYPSKYLHDEADPSHESNIAPDAESSRLLSTKLANIKMPDEGRSVYNQLLKEEAMPSRFDGAEAKHLAAGSKKQPAESSTKVVAAAEKKGYMIDHYEPGDQRDDHQMGEAFPAAHGYMGSKSSEQIPFSAPHSEVASKSGEQPLTHAMINNLQMDPAWDAMEAKMLADHGHQVMPMRVPSNKIEKEMMPPEGEPVGQAYLPHPRHAMHSDMMTDSRTPAEYPQDTAHPPSYYSHYEAHNGPHTIHMGGTLVHAVGDPWKDLKQTSYDQADDNYPSAILDTPMQLVTSSTSASSSGGDTVENSPDIAGGSLDKGSKNKMKESSKFIGSTDKDDDKKPMGGKFKLNGRNSNEETNEGKTSRKPENIGSKVSKEREESDLELIKEISESSQKQAPKAQFKNQEKGEGNSDIVEEVGPSKLIKNQPRPNINKNPSFVTSNNGKNTWKSQKANEGSRFSNGKNTMKDNNNNQRPSQQMQEGQQGFMESGKNQGQLLSQTDSKTGKYITGKFVNFLSDVASHLNVDKLSIAEQLVKDVENSKTKTKSRAGDTREANIVQGDGNLRGREILARYTNNNQGQDDDLSKKLENRIQNDFFQIRREKPEVIKYIWNKGISVLKEE